MFVCLEIGVDVDVGARVYNKLMLFLYMEATPASLYRTWHHTLLSFFHALCTSNCASTKAYASVLKFIKAMAHVADVQKKALTSGKKRDAWNTSMCLDSVQLVLF